MVLTEVALKLTLLLIKMTVLALVLKELALKPMVLALVLVVLALITVHGWVLNLSGWTIGYFLLVATEKLMFSNFLCFYISELLKPILLLAGGVEDVSVYPQASHGLSRWFFWALCGGILH